MAGKQLQSRTVGGDYETSEGSDSETEMPYAQIEHFSEPGTTTAGSSVLETAVEPSNKSVNIAEGLESMGGLQQVTVCSESTTHESSDSLRDFIANMFRSL
jgi:hypothetical protein